MPDYHGSNYFSDFDWLTSAELAFKLSPKAFKSKDRWMTCCPAHNDARPGSFSIEKGTAQPLVVHCFVGCPQDAVIRALQDRGLWPTKTPRAAPLRLVQPPVKATAAELWEPIVPPPGTAPAAPDDKLRCDMLHEYRGLNDELLFYVRRHEAKGEKRKQFYPLTYGKLGTVTGWHSRGPAEPRQLYGLNRLPNADPSATVILTEGEKKCDAAQRMFPDKIAMAWGGGAEAVAKTDYEPLAGRDVILWPDADEPGAKALAYLRTIFPTARIVDTTGLPEGYDAADMLHDTAAHEREAWLRERLRWPEAIASEEESPACESSDPFFVPPKHTLKPVPLVMHRASDGEGQSVPQMCWMVEDWIPNQQATGIYGVGGIMKTRLMQQIFMAKAAGLVVLGRQLEPRPTLGIFCEDTAEECMRQQAAIAAFYRRPLSDFRDFHWVSLVGHEKTELVTFDGQKLAKEELLFWLDYYILKHGIGGVGMDTIAHFFGGDEVKRRDVSRFIRTFDGISITRDCAFVFNAHPSARGKQTGSMESGSTGWEAGVRSRLSFTDPAATENEITDPTPNMIRRVLTRIKSNYAAPGETMELIYREGGFIPAAVDAEAAKLRQKGPGRDAACEERFLDLLAKVGEQGRHVHEGSTAPAYYAPVVFAQHPDGKAFKIADYASAMGRLLNDKRLRIEKFGPASRGWRKLVRTQP